MSTTCPPGARWSTLALAAALALGAFAAPAAANDPVTDLDRRATLALWKSVAPDPSKHKLADVAEDNVRRLDLYKPKNETGAREYALRFGVPAPDGSGRGFHKVLIGGTPVDPTAKGWTLHLTLKDPVAEVWTKRVDKSDSERYVEWAVRGVIGNVMLSIVERRPLADAPAMAVTAVSRRHAALLAAAREAGLFARTRAKLYTGVGEDSAVILGEGAPPLISTSPDGRQLRLTLEMLDAEDRQVEAKWYKIVLTGPLAPFAVVEGATPRPTPGQYVVPTPGLQRTVYVNLQPDSPAMQQALLKHFEQGSKEPSLGIEISARQK